MRFASAILLAIASFAPSQAASAQTCTFVLGFATLRDQIPSIVGTCTENVHYDGVNGDGLQATTTGMLVWGKSDNLAAFTDGYQTWLASFIGSDTALEALGHWRSV